MARREGARRLRACRRERLRESPDPSLVPAVAAVWNFQTLRDVFDCRSLGDRVRSDDLFLKTKIITINETQFWATISEIAEDQVMSRLVNGILLFGLAVSPGFTATVLFQGTFLADDQVALFNITANTSESITIQTDSYGGGTVDSTIVPAGGFAPSAFLFDNLGNVLTLTNGSCGQVTADPITGNCDDLFFVDTLGPGTFTLALVVDDNIPVGTSVTNGFVDDGNPGFTCAEAGTSGSFCDLTTALGDSRTGNFAIAITGADSVTSPEPGSMFLLLAGGALTALLRRRSYNSR
jgi:hypothetical protein